MAAAQREQARKSLTRQRLVPEEPHPNELLAFYTYNARHPALMFLDRAEVPKLSASLGTKSGNVEPEALA